MLNEACRRAKGGFPRAARRRQTARALPTTVASNRHRLGA